MIWRSLICSSLFVAVCQAAVIKGSIAITGNGRNGSKPQNLSGTVLWLEPLSGGLPEPRHGVRLEMVQKNKSFQPHVLALPVGGTVDFPNSDPIFHNAFSNYNGQVFDIGLYPPGSSRRVTFRREGIVRVFCNIHSSMSAVIVVLRSPFYTTSEEDGTFEIDNVPEGVYRLALYHERATEETLASLVRKVDVNSATTDLGVITIAENGYLEIPHLNKYGKPYPPGADANTYPGARQ